MAETSDKLLPLYSPGRFFASQQLKLLLANIMMKYDIEPLASRPQNQWLNNTIGPPVFDKIKVRRRHTAMDESGDVVSGKADFQTQDNEVEYSATARSRSADVRAMC